MLAAAGLAAASLGAPVGGSPGTALACVLVAVELQVRVADAVPASEFAGRWPATHGADTRAA